MEGVNYLRLGNLSSYRLAFELSNYVWKILAGWDYFSKKTVGDQFVRAVDSISANIAEGFGRYGVKDKVLFYRYSLGSLKESFDWNEKAKVRKLLTITEYNYIFSRLNQLPKEINQLIKFTKEKLS